MAEETKTILVVDDDKTVRESMVMLIEHLGYNAIQSDSPADAINKIDKADGILSDNNMVTNDSDDGLNFAKDARAKGFKGPIIVISGRFLPDFVAPPEYGIDFIFSKPVKLAVLGVALENGFKKRGGEDASRTPAALKFAKQEQPETHTERSEGDGTPPKPAL